MSAADNDNKVNGDPEVPEQPNATTSNSNERSKNSNNSGCIGRTREGLQSISERTVVVSVEICVGVAVILTLVALVFKWTLWISFGFQVAAVAIGLFPFLVRNNSDYVCSGGSRGGTLVGAVCGAEGTMRKQCHLASTVLNSLGLIFLVTAIYVAPVFWVWFAFGLLALIVGALLIVDMNKSMGIA